MHSIIRVLSDHTINQIAAGEVIENPASVVKELIENAIDAETKTIRIETQGGGQQLIRVSDDGKGMVRDDALLCLERYSTSKIKEAADLQSLDSMGFRGEALASIAAVSKLSLLTAVEGEEGTRVEVEGGKIYKVEPCARRSGTTIEVRSLFFNVPARKKFQKSSAINAAEITRVVTALALAHPQVGFVLIHQDKEIFATVPDFTQSLEKLIPHRAKQILGDEFAASTFLVEANAHHCQIRGFVAGPSASRANRTGQYLYINRRPVMCPPISLAVKDGFGTRLEPHRHPSFVLHLDIPSSFVDVNVHPQKKEVRFREEPLIKQTIQQAVSLALQGNSAMRSMVAPMAFKAEAFDFSWPSEPSAALRFKEEPLLPKEKIFAFALDPKPIGVFSHYFLVQEPEQEGVFLVDMHAVLSRLIFDAMIEAQPCGFSKQGLMLPVTLQLALPDSETIEACLEELDKIGVEVRKLSHQTFIVEALPSFMEISEIKDVLENIAEEMRSDGAQFQERRQRTAAALAGRFAKAHKRGFMLQEALNLYKQLMRASSPDFCPQGKPTRIHWNDEEISRFFSAKKRS